MTTQLKRRLMRWISITVIATCSGLLAVSKPSKADIWGGDVAVLMQILAEAIQQVAALQNMVGKAKETVSLLEEMNRGVKDVLRLAETAHIPLPKQVYDQAKQIDAATTEARRIYGSVSDRAPVFTRTHYQSGVEALSLSQDAFDYSTFLDEQGRQVKSAAVVSSQATATRLTAETLGVMLHSMSHSTRIEAKALELSSTRQIEESAQESSRYESFLNTHDRFESALRESGFSSLNSFGEEN